MEELVLAEEGFTELKMKMEKSYTDMKIYYNAALALQKDIEDSSWKGKAKVECCAFLELIVQYHKALMREPLDDNRQTMGEIEEKIVSYLGGSRPYQKLQ